MRIISLLIILLLIPTKNEAQESYGFSNPSFTGNGFSAHVLTIEQMRQQSADEETDRLAAIARDAEREEQNSNVNRFINNFESRVYAQLSKDLVDKLFGEDPSSSGSFEVGGNTIDYTNDGVDVTLTITAPGGEITEITVPIGSFGL